MKQSYLKPGIHIYIYVSLRALGVSFLMRIDCCADVYGKNVVGSDEWLFLDVHLTSE